MLQPPHPRSLLKEVRTYAPLRFAGLSAILMRLSIFSHRPISHRVHGNLLSGTSKNLSEEAISSNKSADLVFNKTGERGVFRGALSAMPDVNLSQHILKIKYDKALD